MTELIHNDSAQSINEAKNQICELQKIVIDYRQQIEALNDEKNDLLEENDLLLLQLHQVQEELEALFLQHQSLIPELDANRLAREKLEKAIIELARARDIELGKTHQMRDQIDSLITRLDDTPDASKAP